MSNITVKDFLNKNESFGFFTKSVETVSKAYSIAGFCMLLKDMGKQVKLVVKELPSMRIRKMFERREIEIVDSVRNSSYVISIDYSKGNVDKVSYDKDEKTGKVNIHIFPKNESFDFNNIEYTEGGTDFDGVLAYDLESLEEMGDIYIKNKKLFTVERVFSIGMKFGLGNYAMTELNYINVDFGNAYTGGLLKMLTHEYKDIPIKAMAAQVFMNGLVYESNILEGSSLADNILDLLNLLKRNGGSFTRSLKTIYFSHPLDLTLIKNRLVESVEIDEKNRTAWSKVSYEHINQISDNPAKLYDVTKTRLPYHESKSIDLSIGVFELKEGELTVLVQSSIPDKISASAIVESFDGVGDDSSASCVLDDVAFDDFEEEFFPVINDLYGKNLEPEEDEEDNADGNETDEDIDESVSDENTSEEGEILITD